MRPVGQRTRSRRRGSLAVVSLVLLLASAVLPAPGASASRWMRIDTPNFVVIGDADEKTLRSIAIRFEGFREGLRRVLSTEARSTAVPMVVIVFRSDQGFRPFKPTYRGEIVEVWGWFSPGNEIDFVSLTAEATEWTERGLSHEYAHAVLDNVVPGLPLWLNEGLAEYYSTFEQRRNGREAVVGRAIDGHLRRLRRTGLLPFERLFDVDQTSPLYNEGQRQRSVFYAQSWALVHMLLHGEEDEGARLWTFVRAVSDGMPATKAWRQVFGEEDVESRLRRYVRGRRFSSDVHELAERVEGVEATASDVPDAVVEAWLGDLLFRQGRLDEAAVRLEKAVALRSTGGRAEATLALLRLRQGRRDDARQLVRTAFASAAGDWMVRYYAAAGAVRLWLSENNAAAARQELKLPRAILTQLVEEHPDVPHALWLLGTANFVVGEDLTDARRVLERAFELAPGRDDYATMLAQVLARQGDYERATEVLGLVLGRARNAGTRETVRRLLERIATAEREAAERSEGGC